MLRLEETQINASLINWKHQQKHNVQCTEGFYRDNVMQAMQNQRPTEEEKKKVMKALKRIHESEHGKSIW